MSGIDDTKQDAAHTLIIDTMYRLTNAMASDTDNALAAGKDQMLQRAITKALQLKNDESLGLVLKKCYDMDDSVSMELFNSFVERYSMVGQVAKADGSTATSYLFTIPVTLARTNNEQQPNFAKDASYAALLQSIGNLFHGEDGTRQVFLSDYLYHPSEVEDMDPSDLYGFHQGLIDHAAKEHDPQIVNKVLCRYGWPPAVTTEDDMAIELFFLIGSVVMEGEEEDPFIEIDDEAMLEWRGETAALVEGCLGLQQDEGFALLGDIDLFYHALRNGAVEHKEFAFDLEVENLVMRDKFPPQALSVLVVQYGDNEVVDQVHVSIVSILDNVVRCGFVYGLEHFESTDEVIDNMIETMQDWDITRIKVMDAILPMDDAFQEGEPVFLLPEQSDAIAGSIDIDGKKERLLH